MILSNEAIQAAIDEARLVITPEPLPRRPGTGDECPYQTSAVDLRLGNEISVYREPGIPVTVDLTAGRFREYAAAAMEPRTITTSQPWILEPNTFILGRTHERVALPLQAALNRSLAARVEGKSSYARCGLLVHFTAPTIHAGFEGTVTLEIINLGKYKISLRPLMPICQLIIEEVGGIPFRNEGQFQGQSRPGGQS